MRLIPSSLTVKKIPPLFGIFLVTMLITGGTVGQSAQAQVSYPGNIFASTNQAQLHELVLKAKQENGQANTEPFIIPSFKTSAVGHLIVLKN